MFTDRVGLVNSGRYSLENLYRVDEDIQLRFVSFFLPDIDILSIGNEIVKQIIHTEFNTSILIDSSHYVIK